MRTGVVLPRERRAGDERKAVAARQHAVDDQHVIVAAVGEREAAIAVAGDMRGVPGLGERLFQIVGSFAVVFDDKNLHRIPIRRFRLPSRLPCESSGLAALLPAGGSCGSKRWDLLPRRTDAGVRTSAPSSVGRCEAPGCCSGRPRAAGRRRSGCVSPGDRQRHEAAVVVARHLDEHRLAARLGGILHAPCRSRPGPTLPAN